MILLKNILRPFSQTPIEKLEDRRRKAAEDLVRAQNTHNQGKIATAQERYDLIAQKYGVASGEIPDIVIRNS